MAFGTVLPGWADEPEAAAAEPTITAGAERRMQALDEFAIIGSPDAAFTLPGSGYYFSEAHLRELNYTDINQVLRQVPGVYVRQEDGYGNFPNISLRGVNGTRSSKVTMMEDGVLTSPAPYSNPAAYYVPALGRMSGLEVLKGSSQVKYGPETTGGVLNYLSTPIPAQWGGHGRFSVGNYSDIQAHVYGGGFHETDVGRIGIMAEYYTRRTDGFRELDSTAAFDARGADTGFDRNDYMVKLRFEPNWQTYNYFEYKLGYTDFDAEETYLGVSSGDFRASPLRRYAASRDDRMDSFGTRMYLRHYVEPSDTFRLTTTGYYQRFNRNWYKLHELRPGGALTSSMPLSQALFNGTPGYDILTGTAEGTLRYRANNRAYKLYGIQSNAEWEFETGAVNHTLELGLRLHHDYEDRFQHNVDYSQDAQGAFIGRNIFAPGSQDNRRGEATAFALYLQDRMEYGNLALIPGVRWEHINYKFIDRNAGVQASTDLDIVVPGVGLEYTVNPEWMAFGGYYRGFSAPGPGAATQHIRNPARPKVKEETSDSFEAGLRYRNPRGVRAELIGFYTFFNNLIVAESIGSGVSQTENVGKVNSRGIEALVGIDPALMAGYSRLRTPLTLAGTFTDARLNGDATSNNAETIFSGGRDGNRVPYTPRWQFNLTGGVEYERFRGYVGVNWVDKSFASANNSSAEVNPNTGVADARFGVVDSFWTVDLSAYYRLWREVDLFAYVQNVFDESYMTSRLPHGPRPGAPRMFGVGIQATF